MRVGACVLVMLAACKDNGGGEGFPIIPQGDDSPVTPAPDAPTTIDASGDGSTTLAGRVCVLSDLRQLTTCTDQGAAGINVQLGASTGLTSDDGTFSIARPAGSNLTWVVAGANYVTSIMPLGTEHLIPLVRSAAYETLLLDNGMILQAGQGSIVGRVLQQGAPLAGATVAVSPPAQYAPLYDGASATLWDQDATGGLGVFWIAGAPVGTSTITVTAPSTTTSQLAVPVAERAITFATVEFP